MVVGLRGQEETIVMGRASLMWMVAWTTAICVLLAGGGCSRPEKRPSASAVAEPRLTTLPIDIRFLDLGFPEQRAFYVRNDGTEGWQRLLMHFYIVTLDMNHRRAGYKRSALAIAMSDLGGSSLDDALHRILAERIEPGETIRLPAEDFARIDSLGKPSQSKPSSLGQTEHPPSNPGYFAVCFSDSRTFGVWRLDDLESLPALGISAKLGVPLVMSESLTEEAQEIIALVRRWCSTEWSASP